MKNATCLTLCSYLLSISVAGSILPVFADKLSSLNKGDTIWLAKPNFSQLNLSPLSGLFANSLKRWPLFPRGLLSQRKVETTASSLVVSRSYQNHQHEAVSNQLTDVGRGDSARVGDDSESVDVWQIGCTVLCTSVLGQEHNLIDWVRQWSMIRTTVHTHDPFRSFVESMEEEWSIRHAVLFP